MSRLPSRLALVVAGALLLVAPAGASAAKPLRDGALQVQSAPDAPPQTYADGDWATIYSQPDELQPGQLVALRNDRTGELVRPRPGCRLTQPEGGYSGELCGDGVWRAVNLRTGARAPIPLGDLVAEVPGAVNLVGHDWAFWSSNVGRSAYVNWRTGEQRTAPSSQYDFRFAYDRAAGGPLPRLIKGTTLLGTQSIAFFPQYPEQPLHSLRLRVGKTTRTIVARCAAPGCAVNYSGGVLVWSEGIFVGTQRVGVYLPRSNRRLTWNVPDLGDGGISLAHTSRRLYIAVGTGVSSSSTTVHFEAALPAQ